MSIYSFIIVWWGEDNMHRGAAAAASSVKRKNAKEYSKDLCVIMRVPGYKLDNITLFDKIFEILDQDVTRSIEPTLEDDAQLWFNTCNEFCTESKRVLDLLRDIFYTEGKPIVYKITKRITTNIGLPRVLFFELLLYLIVELSKKEYNKEYFEAFISTVNHSDSSGILSYGVSDIEYFRFVTNENVEKINIKLREIDSIFTTDAPRQGNYTLAHVISSYCNGKLREHKDLILSQSQSDAQPDLDPISLMNVPPDWKANIRLATLEDIKRYNEHKVSEEQRQKIEDTKRQHAEQVAKFILERKELERKELERKELERKEHARMADTEQKDDRPVCFYAPKCYQHGEAHWRDFQHKKQQGPIARPTTPKGGRRRQSKRSKYNTVRCSPSSTKRTRHSKHRPRRHTHTRRRRRH
jgi:hypothetical protein